MLARGGRFERVFVNKFANILSVREFFDQSRWKVRGKGFEHQFTSVLVSISLGGILNL